MSHPRPDISPPVPSDERPPLLQRLFDNVFLLLALGIVSTVMVSVYATRMVRRAIAEELQEPQTIPS